MTAPLRITKPDQRNTIKCISCSDDAAAHVGAYQCPNCGKHPLCIAHYDEHMQQCGTVEIHNIILLRSRLGQCVNEGSRDSETAHLAADNALLDYVGDDDVRDLFRRINKRYA